MKLTTLAVEKADVGKLERDELEQLADLKSHPGFSCLQRIAEDAVQKQLEASIASTDMEEIERIKYLSSASFMREAWEFLFDAVERAKKELRERKSA